MNLEFNLRNLTAQEMNDFLAAVGTNDLVAVSTTLAQVVTKCPPDWGDPADANTYLALAYFGEFQDVIEALTEASKKFLRQ